MQFQTAVTRDVSEVVFRVGVNANTITGTITAGSIGINTPVILATHTDSLGSNWVTRPATKTSVVNNLLVGLVKQVPSTNPTYLDREQQGLIQCYGYFPDAIVQRSDSASAVAGQIAIPESLQFLAQANGPVTAPATIASTDTAAFGQVPALGGLVILMEALASSSATETAAVDVFLRCM
jgi:hypothetical protein